MNANFRLPRFLFYGTQLVLLLLSASCTMTMLSKSEAIQIADKAFAQFSGLSDADTVRSVSRGRGKWIIIYERKTFGDELTLGDHWAVFVNDKSRGTEIILGQ